jgi:hypothetical protein
MDKNVYSRNGFIFTEKFPDMGLRTRDTGGFTTVAQKHELAVLRTVFDSENLVANRYIYVRGDCYKQPWAKEVFKLDGLEVIAVPANFVLLVSEFPLNQNE